MEGNLSIILAQGGISSEVKTAILVMALIAIALIVAKALGWNPPWWFWRIVIVVALVVFAFFAINIIMTMW